MQNRLYLLFTPGLCVSDPWKTLHAALRGGVDLVQWRVPEPDPVGLARCIAMAKDHGVGVIVNDDVEAAVAVGAAGVHVGQDDMDPGRARLRIGSNRTVGVSTHDQTQIIAAHGADADYIGFGPCFPTATKGYTSGLPTSAVRAATAWCSNQNLPLFAIGGITVDRLPELVAAGVDRIAVTAAILKSDRPELAAQALRRGLGPRL